MSLGGVEDTRFMFIAFPSIVIAVSVNMIAFRLA
jgi:hypothetical protein